MPTIKHAYCHCQVKSDVLLAALPKLGPNPLCEYMFIGKDQDGDNLGFEVLRRWTKVGRLYDDSHKQFVGRDLPQEKLLTFYLRDGIVEMPSTRAAKQFVEVMKHIGLGQYGVYTVEIDLLNWLKGALMLHSGSQFGGMTLHGYSAEGKLFGKYDAKSIDNRVHMDLMTEHAKQLTSVKIAWFDDGMKYSAQVGDNGKLECGCKDADALLDFYESERALMLQHALPCPQQTNLEQFMGTDNTQKEL